MFIAGLFFLAVGGVLLVFTSSPALGLLLFAITGICVLAAGLTAVAQGHRRLRCWLGRAVWCGVATPGLLVKLAAFPNW